MTVSPVSTPDSRDGSSEPEAVQYQPNAAQPNAAQPSAAAWAAQALRARRAARLPSWPRQAYLVLCKDLAIELKSGEVTVPSAFFALLVVVLSSMAFLGGRATEKGLAAGVIWLSVAFAAVLSLGRSWARERESSALDGLLGTPLSASALFVGKALGLWAFCLAIELVVFPVTWLFFSIDPGRYLVGMALVALLTTPGIAAAGTLFGALTVRTRARDLVLSVVLFPLLAPVLLVAVSATRELLGGAAWTELGGHARLLAVFALAFWSAGIALFGTLIDD
ncbi:MAG TPA: heme exporter protein CcmB [Polyangiaceae bacterium]|nr:heme exporter protein CcmB [Polyangiaceae bacterium]